MYKRKATYRPTVSSYKQSKKYPHQLKNNEKNYYFLTAVPV